MLRRLDEEGRLDELTSIERQLTAIPSTLEAGQQFTPLCETLVGAIQDGTEAPAALDRLRQRAETDGGAWGIPRANFFDALFAEDRDEVEVAVRELLAAHEETNVDNPELRPLRQQVAYEICAYIELARRRNLPVTVDSEYVPECVYTE